jgi:biotin-dependent carboxylase-like uncharacterized protein
LHAIANRLVGNDANATTIEYTLTGDSYAVAKGSCRIAVAGDFDLKIDEQKVAPWRSYTLNAGQQFTVGYARQGVRGYLAVEGGFMLPLVLGSSSVHTRSGIGPWGGKPIRASETIPLMRDAVDGRPESEFDISVLPPPVSTLRVIWGPQELHFDAEAREQFLESTFTVTPKCDRMGYQLAGPEIQYRAELPLISEGVALGSIQVPGRGLFIANMVDRQTIGGYAKIATIISSDIRELVQMRQGQTVRFVPISIVEAQKIGRERSSMLRGLSDLIQQQGHRIPDVEDLLSMNLISGVYFDQN